MGILDRYIFRSVVSGARKSFGDSGTRNFYKGYFLDGIQSEARRMDRATEKILVADTAYAIVPILLSSFAARIKEGITDNTSAVFSSAKSMYDNLNRFLQSAYISEEELERRHKNITETEIEFTSAVGNEFNLKKITQVGESGRLDFCLKNLGYLNDITTQVVSSIRNATEHGHGHMVLTEIPSDSTPLYGKGFGVRQEVSKKVCGSSISGLVFKLSGDVMGLTHKIPDDYSKSV